jgi:phosphoglycolate phosphatase-like HAD superfamily hydrolase
VDSAPGIILSAQKTFEEMGLEPPTSEFLRAQIGPPIAKYFEKHFKDEHKAIFKEIAGDLLVKLGYESSYDW